MATSRHKNKQGQSSFNHSQESHVRYSAKQGGVLYRDSSATQQVQGSQGNHNQLQQVNLPFNYNQLQLQFPASQPQHYQWSNQSASNYQQQGYYDNYQLQGHTFQQPLQSTTDFNQEMAT